MLNYRHSLQTMRKHLLTTGHDIEFFIENGKPYYVFKETIEGNRVICGWAYSASDAADIVNKLCKYY